MQQCAKNIVFLSDVCYNLIVLLFPPSEQGEWRRYWFFGCVQKMLFALWTGISSELWASFCGRAASLSHPRIYSTVRSAALHEMHVLTVDWMHGVQCLYLTTVYVSSQCAASAPWDHQTSAQELHLSVSTQSLDDCWSIYCTTICYYTR